MAFTDADAEILRRAIASGTRRVRYKDREVEYHSLEDMVQALTLIQSEIAGTGTGADVRPSYARVSISKGFDRGW